MTERYGYAGKILIVNLTDRTSETIDTCGKEQTEERRQGDEPGRLIEPRHGMLPFGTGFARPREGTWKKRMRMIGEENGIALVERAGRLHSVGREYEVSHRRLLFCRGLASPASWLPHCGAFKISPRARRGRTGNANGTL